MEAVYWGDSKYLLQRTIRLARTQKFPENQYFLLPDTYTYVCISRGKNF